MMIGVVLDRDKVSGIDRLEGAVDAGSSEMVTMDDALTMEWGSDAHVTCYSVPGEQSWPRLNKPVLPEIRKLGNDVEMHWLLLDYDNADHGGWTPETVVMFCDILSEAQADGFELAQSWSYFYTTKGGARFVYRLSRPVSPEEFEPMYRGVLRDWSRYFDMDSACDQWNRLFRLPRVVRKGKKTSDSIFFDFIEGEPGVMLNPDTIKPGEKKLSDNVVGEKLDIPLPDAEDAAGMVWTGDDKARLTDLGKRLRARLKGRDCYPCIFEHRSIGGEGERDNTLQRLVGSACALTHNIPGNSPEAIYGLFAEAVFDLEPDRHTPDWSVTAWKAVLKWWAKEDALVKRDEETRVETEKENANFAYALVDRMARWCEAPQLLLDNKGDAAQWMSQHMIACCNKGYYVMRPDGYFDRSPVSANHLPAKIRELKMSRLISLEVPRVNGNGVRDRTSQEIINQHGTLVPLVEGVVTSEGTCIRNIRTDRATMLSQLYKYNPRVMSRFSQDVDDWLLHLSGSRWNYSQIVHWISHALNFAGGATCALSVTGPPAIGKKLLAQGLAECVDSEMYADSSEFGRFQAMLLRTPFLVVNEGFPDLHGAKKPADSFRSLVVGDPMQIERKFMDPITVRNPLRLLFTANNLEVIETLAGGRDLSPDDRRALGQRLLHFDLGDKGQHWLSSKGGMRFTAKKGKRWIRGDDGSDSDYVVANHFMWLYENRKPPTGDRLLVEGDKESPLVQSFATRSGSAPAVIEVVCKMVESRTPFAGFVVHEESGRVWATPSAVVDCWRAKLSGQSRIELTARKVGQVFRGLRVAGSSMNPRRLPPETEIARQARWIELDASLLLHEAEEFGYENDKLRAVAHSRYTNEVKALS